MPNLRHTNEVLRAYVTSGGRLQLYAYLDRLGERVVYCDTDSVLFVQKESEPALIECRDILGDMKSERKTNEYSL